MKQKPPVGEGIGIVGSLVTIFSFIGVTPGMIGETAYQIWFYASPFLCLLFGILIGWSAHERYINKEEKKQEKDREARNISNFKALEFDFKYLVGTIYAFGYVDYPDYEYENGLLQFFPNEVPLYLEIETIQDGVRVTLQKWVKDLINSNKYLLDCVKDDYRAEEMK